MRRLIITTLGLGLALTPTVAQAATHKGVTATERLAVCNANGATVYRVRVVNNGTTEVTVKATRDVHPDRPWEGTWKDLRFAHLAPGDAKVFRLRIANPDAAMAFSVISDRHVIASGADRRDLCP